MTKDNDKNKNRLTSLDINLWKALTQDVTRAKGKEYINAPAKKPTQHTAPSMNNIPTTQKPAAPHFIAPSSKSMDRRTQAKLQQGKIRPEAKIDLHGMTQDEAYNALHQFIKRSYALKKRCLLVITGKGKSTYNRHNNFDEHWLDDNMKPGILKRLTPGWLQSPSLAQFIVQFIPAHAKDGGDGAMYIYLHKNKAK